MNIRVTKDLKRATCKSENWLLQTKDRHHIEYIQDDISYLIEVEYGTDYENIYKFIYFDTIKALDTHISLNDIEKAGIKKRVALALDAMGGKYEFC